MQNCSDILYFTLNNQRYAEQKNTKLTQTLRSVEHINEFVMIISIGIIKIYCFY